MLDGLLAYEEVHATASQQSLRLDPTDPKDGALVKAFEEAGLDHRNPLHWRSLLESFAEAHFGKNRTKPKTWDAAAYWELYLDCLRVKVRLRLAKKPYALSDVQLVKRLQSEANLFRNDYKKYNERALRRLIAQSRDPVFNIALRYPGTTSTLKLLRAEYEAEGRNWSTDIEAQIKPLFEKGLELAGQPKDILALPKVSVEPHDLEKWIDEFLTRGGY